MKFFILLAALVMVLGLCGITFANNDYSTVEKTIKGENDSCPMLSELGVAHTWNKGAKLEVKTQLSYTNSIRSFTENNSVKVSNILEF